MVLEHIVSNPASVKFRKVRYFEHRSPVGGRIVLTAIVVCGQITIAGQKGEPYRRFLSWVFIDLETGQYDENKYVVAFNYPNQTVDLYAHYHVALCSNSEDGLSLESRIGALAIISPGMDSSMVFVVALSQLSQSVGLVLDVTFCHGATLKLLT